MGTGAQVEGPQGVREDPWVMMYRDRQHALLEVSCCLTLSQHKICGVLKLVAAHERCLGPFPWLARQCWLR